MPTVAAVVFFIERCRGYHCWVVDVVDGGVGGEEVGHGEDNGVAVVDVGGGQGRCCSETW